MKCNASSAELREFMIVAQLELKELGELRPLLRVAPINEVKLSGTTFRPASIVHENQDGTWGYSNSLCDRDRVLGDRRASFLPIIDPAAIPLSLPNVAAEQIRQVNSDLV